MTVAGLIEALQKLDPDAFVVVGHLSPRYLVHVGAVRPIKAICWADDLNDPGFFEEGDAAGAYDVVHLAPRELPNSTA